MSVKHAAYMEGFRKRMGLGDRTEWWMEGGGVGVGYRYEKILTTIAKEWSVADLLLRFKKNLN